MEELDKVKVIIRSMLISEPTQRMTVREIARRHREDEGRPIPYVKMGFDSLGDFLRSIPDIVHFTGYGEDATLRPVISDEVSHIQAMIVRQKPPKSKARRYRQPPSGSSHFPWSSNSSQHSYIPTQNSWNQPRQPPRFSNYTQNFGASRQPQTLPSLLDYKFPTKVSHHEIKSDNFGTGSPETMHRKEEVFLPASTKQKLLQIVRDNPGQSIKSFETSVVKGYPHIAALFPKIEDLIWALKSLNIVAGGVYLVNEVASGDSKQVSEKFEYKAMESSSHIIPAGMENDSDYESFHNDINDALGAKELSSSKPSSQYDPPAGKQPLSDENAALQRLRQHTSSIWGNGERCMGDDIKKRLVDLLCYYPTGIACSMLPDLFKSHNKFELDYRACGFASVIEMLRSCPEQFVCLQESGTWKVCNAKGYWTDSGCIPGHIKEKITQLISKYPGGVHVDAFADIYQRMCGRRFDYREFGFDSIENLFVSINNDVVKTKTEANRFMIYPLGTNENQEDRKPDLIAQATAMPEHGESGILHLIPRDCICPDYEFPKLVMPEGIVPGSSLCLIIASVSNLDNFYVLIRGKGYSESLDSLADKMTVFYELHKQKYRIPPEAVRPGVICVTLTFKEYSRCIISSENNTDDVTVIPMDYGCTTTAKKNELYFMHKDFAQLPPQAINCRCANLAPPFNELSFNRRAAVRLLELVKDKAIFAQIAQFDQQRNFLSVGLIDTTVDEDVHINDVLCQEGLASFRMDTLITVKAPIINSSLRLLDRLKQEKQRVKGRNVTNKGYSDLNMPITNIDPKSAGDVNPSPVNSVFKPKQTLRDKLVALHANAESPISLISQLSLNAWAGQSSLSETSDSPESVLQSISPQKLADRTVR